MKRKSLDDLFNDLHITINNKKPKIKHECKEIEKIYTKSEVDILLKSQEEYLFKEFKKYVETMRSTVDIQLPHWAC